VNGAAEATTSNENVIPESLENVEGVKSRWAKVLKDAGVETVADYLEHRGESVLGFGEAGRKSVDEALRDAGISVPED
jgi:DNA-directed RNA polymerase alpha subunit